jgi:hypothetical protein
MKNTSTSAMSADALRAARTRQAQVEPGLPNNGKVKTERVNLGLALLSRHAVPGVPLALDDIAPWCGVTNAAISSIVQKALRKLRRKTQADPALAEFLREGRWK